VTWEELSRPRGLQFTPEETLARVSRLGDLFAPALTVKQRLPSQPRTPRAPARTSPEKRDDRALPKPGSQSGRRLFLVTKTEMGNELWIEMRGKFKRFILRPDRHGGRILIAMPAGEFAIDAAYYRAEVPKEWKRRVTIEDSGSYEVIEGSWQVKRFALWFNGGTLRGRWVLHKPSGEGHRSWTLDPAG
jgi:hypothetical protein